MEEKQEHKTRLEVGKYITSRAKTLHITILMIVLTLSFLMCTIVFCITAFRDRVDFFLVASVLLLISTLAVSGVLWIAIVKFAEITKRNQEHEQRINHEMFIYDKTDSQRKS